MSVQSLMVSRHRHRTPKRTPTYNSWRAMVSRCHYPPHPFYADYGGRGIIVHAAWRGPGGFARFLAYLGERPAGMTLDRIDVDGDYVPGNVRWNTVKGQRWNRRDMRARQQTLPMSVPAGTPASEMPF